MLGANEARSVLLQPRDATQVRARDRRSGFKPANSERPKETLAKKGPGTTCLVVEAGFLAQSRARFGQLEMPVIEAGDVGIGHNC